MAAYDNLQAELDKMQHTSMNNTTSVGGPQNQPVKLLVSNNSGNIVQGTSLLANPQHNQLLQFSSLGGQITQAVGKRPSSNQSGPMTKVIIRNTSTGQQQVVPISGNQNLSNTIMVSSPSKTITLSAGSLGSPQKILTTPATPTKQIVPLGKLPITPLKTPPKITMIPVSIGKSPRQGSGQMVTMLGAKSSFAMQGGAITTTATSKPTTITMSPSKVIIKGQPVTMQPGMQQMMNTSLGGATSLVAPRPTGSTMSSSLQPVSVSGSKFQYVRLVTAPTSQQQHSAGGTRPQMQPVNARSIMPSHIPQGNMKIAMQPLQQMQQVKSGNFASQRLILPATTQIPIQPNRPQATLAQIRPASGSTHISQIGGTTSINLQNLQGVQGFTLVPANQVQYVTQVQSQPPAPTIKQENFVQITSSGPPPSSSKSNFNGSTSASSDGTGQRPRKPCNCTKSQCLKLYCDCFANGEFCSNCNCNNCANNLEHEDERSRAIKSCLERNPLAFHPKIGGYKTGKGRGEGDRRHNKGCNCKRSGCLKNYCECYEAKIMCSSLCKCVGCKNFEESPDRKTLMHLADAAEVRVQQQTAAKSKLSSQIADLPPRPAAPAAGERLPFTFVTGDVAEATCACLVAQAEEAERTRQIEMVTERMILEEFGRCLMQVIESANRTKAHSPVP